MTSLEASLALLRAYRQEVGERYGIEALGVFGSVARGEDRGDSDLDVVVRLHVPNLLTLSRIRLDLEERSGRHVDIVRYRDSLAPVLKRRLDAEAHYA